MFRRIGISLIITVALMALLAAVVGAQSTTDDAETIAPSIVPMGGGIVQAIPLTLTINVPGPDGMQSVDVPIVLSLDIQIALGNVLTSSVVVTAEVPDAAAAEPVEEETAEVEEQAEATVPPPMTPTPTPIPPTATPAEPTAAPTEAAPTPAPVGQTEEPEPTEAPEVEPTAEAGEEVTPGEEEDTQDAEPTAEPEEEDTPDDEGEAVEEGEVEATPEPESEAVIDTENCSDSRSIIYAPAAGEAVSGNVEILGTAEHESFNYYKLEYQQTSDETGEFAFIMDSATSVIDGMLAELDTAELDNGSYVLRLTVVDNTGNFPPQCSVPVEIDN